MDLSQTQTSNIFSVSFLLFQEIFSMGITMVGEVEWDDRWTFFILLVEMHVLLTLV